MYTRNYVQEGGGIQLGKSDQKERKGAGGHAVKWTDAEDIGIALTEKFPDADPLTIRFTDLRENVLALDGFDDDPKTSNEPKLEAIQMAWYEEWKDVAGVSLRAASSARGCAATSFRSPPAWCWTISAFLPWVIVGDVSRRGVPDFWALWVAGLGAAAAVLAMLSLITRKNSRHPLLVVGLLALGIMFLAWRIMPRTAGSARSRVPRRSRSSRTRRRHQRRAHALAGSGIYVGLVAAAVLVCFGLTIVVKRAAQPYVLPTPTTTS